MTGVQWLAPGLVGFFFGIFVGFIVGIAAAVKLGDVENKSNRK